MTGPADRTTRAWLPSLPRLDGTWLPRTAIAVGIGATIAMNVYGGLWDGGPGGALVAALYPVALVLSVETLVWMFRRFGPPRRPFAAHWEMWAATTTLASLAGITGVISYLHALTVLQRTGSYGLVAHLGPLVPDQLILTGTLALLAMARAALPDAARPEHTPAERTTTQPRKRTAAKREPRRSNEAEEARIANLVRQLDRIPSDRTIAADYCGGNRRMARRVLELAKATNGHTPEGGN